MILVGVLVHVGQDRELLPLTGSFVPWFDHAAAASSVHP